MDFKINENKDKIYIGEDEFNAVAFINFPKNYDNKYTITKVFVDNSLRGQGVAGKLMDFLVEYAINNNLKLNATCSYAVSWFEKNIEKYNKVKF